jgi:hypothetical protein
LVCFVQSGVYDYTVTKKVVGVFVRFRAPLHPVGLSVSSATRSAPCSPHVKLEARLRCYFPYNVGFEHA